MLKLIVLTVVLVACWRANIMESILELSKQQLTRRFQELSDEYKAVVKRDLDSQMVLRIIQEQTHIFNENAQFFVKKFKEESNAHQADVDRAVRKLQQKLTDTAEGIRKIFACETTADIQKQWKDVAEIERLAKSFEPDFQELQSIGQKISKIELDYFVTIGKIFETNIEEAIAEHEKTFKIEHENRT